MMITLQDKQAFSELSNIIKMMPQYMKEKINLSFINFIEKNKDTTYVPNINIRIPLRNQQISEYTEAYLALIYRDYLCSEDEKNKLLVSEREELDKLELENSKNCEINFPKRNFELSSNTIDSTTSQDNLSLIEYKKENFITKLFNKIKNIFQK